MLIVTPNPSPQHNDAPVAWDWVRSADGLAAADHGSGPAAQLPKGGECVLVLAPSSVRWHRIQLPVHPPAKRAAVLTSVLDELILGEPEQLHAALPESANVAQVQWCAVVNKPWLQALLGDLRAAAITPHRIVPMLSPDGQAQGLVWPWQDSWRLSVATPQGLIHAAVTQDLAQLTSDDPAAELALRNLRCPSPLAGAVETAWPSLNLQVRSSQALLVEAAQSTWNLAQFDLKVSATQRRGQALSRAWTQFAHSPAWRITRWGVTTALIGALALPPALAWRERQVQATAAQSARQIVQDTFPDIQLVIDPMTQMRRGLDALARSKGLASGPNITAALSQWGTVPNAEITGLRWDNNAWQVTLAGTPSEATINQALRRSGWRVQAGPNQTWTLLEDKGAR
jgi:general secretion pathway protein L